MLRHIQAWRVPYIYSPVFIADLQTKVTVTREHSMAEYNDEPGAQGSRSVLQENDRISTKKNDSSGKRSSERRAMKQNGGAITSSCSMKTRASDGGIAVYFRY